MTMLCLMYVCRIYAYLEEMLLSFKLFQFAIVLCVVSAEDIYMVTWSGLIAVQV